jgi:hypothetical protein
MQMTINKAEIACLCACGYEEIIHIEHPLAIGDLEEIIEMDLEELGWYGGECPDCARDSIKESRGCHDLHVERDYMFA